MIKLLRKLATAMLPALLCGTLFIGCEADDKYTKVDDLFQPRFVLEKPEVKANSVTLVWYKVNDAISYTVQLHQDQYYTSLFMEIETTDPYVFIDDIPYGTTFYIRFINKFITIILYVSYYTIIFIISLYYCP